MDVLTQLYEKLDENLQNYLSVLSDMHLKVLHFENTNDVPYSEVMSSVAKDSPLDLKFAPLNETIKYNSSKFEKEMFDINLLKLLDGLPIHGNTPLSLKAEFRDLKVCFQGINEFSQGVLLGMKEYFPDLYDELKEPYPELFSLIENQDHQT
eukprot:TRINITY_DN11915_c0_g1_i1.p1 TRINITY_DN11915_c0_g1~~TRINITY_DN11915_c0_g1_i1.p1  ORF type:complete len:152 (-),score=49.26 TRINITY_DN11915_c0_g1_i1:145-600(-)